MNTFPLSLRRLVRLTLAPAIVTALLGAVTVAPVHAAPPVVTTWWSPDATSVPLGTPASFTVQASATSVVSRGDTWAYVDHIVDGEYVENYRFTGTGTSTLSIPLPTDTMGTAVHRFEIFDPWVEDPFLVVERNLTVYGEPTTVSAKWPGRSVMTLNRKAIVRGDVTGALPRDVLLQVQGQFGWDTLASTTVNGTGAYALSIPTNWYTSHDLRVHVPGTASHDSASAAKGMRMAVVPTYKPKGPKKAFSLYGDRWDPCKTITYKVNPTGMPKNVSLRDFRKAFALFSDATGIKFAYVGRTDMVPMLGASLNGSPKTYEKVEGANIAIGFATPKQVPGLRGSIVGLAGPTSSGRWNGDTFEYTEGQVVFDRTFKYTKKGFGQGFTWGELILHEVGHALGLHHAMRRYQVMSYDTLAKDRFGAGDLAGLQQIGRSAGCFISEDSAHRPSRPARGLPPIHATGANQHGLIAPKGHAH